MSLAPGARLGPYEVVAPLGAGGMGEVYRARDTRLQRDVAVKVLSQHLSSNSQSRSRFEREAKAISSLNHPHICTLHDVGREGDADYLVMELVDGETLEARLSRGALPTLEVLRVAAQIASALESAHRAGVVHRDLKPANIMLTKSGAKLMDFGLAKEAGPGSTSPALTAAPTATSPLTTEGSIVGTFQYMPPEQLEGREADARSDLFALGLVIYEMATGRRAFAGKTQASLIAAILKDEPAPIAATAAMSPPALDRLVRLCLRKDPDERIQTAHDIRLRLEEIAEAAPERAAGAGVTAAGAASARTAWRERAAWAIAGLASLLAIVLALRPFRQEPPAAPILFSSIPAPAGGSFVQSTIGLALSPDGRRIAFVARSPSERGLYVRALGERQATLLARSDDAGCPVFSPDGRSLAFYSEGHMRKADLASGQTDLLAAANDCFGASWAGDGTILFVPERNAPIMRLPRPGAEAEKLAIEGRKESQRIYTSPSLLPDGRHILYTVNEAWEGGENSGVYAATIDGKEERRLLPFLTNARFVAPGYLVYGRDGSLRAQRFDPERLALSGEPITLLDDVQYLGFYQTYVFTIADNGLLAYIQGGGTLARQFTWVDRKGAVVGTIGSPGNLFSPRLSHDGRRLAYDLSDAATDNGDIWVLDLERGIPTRLTFDPHNESAPFWSPDDTRIAFFTNFPGGRNVLSIASDGRGNQESILSNGQDNLGSDWSSDGESIVVQSRVQAGQGATDLGIVSVQKKTVETWLSTPFTEKQARFSPDGRWIAYDSDESGRIEIYVRAFASPGGKWRVSSAGGSSAVWSRNGRELFYLTPNFELMSVAVTPGAVFQGGTPVQLFKVPGETLDLGVATQYDVTPDGQRFLLNLNVATQGQKLITIVSQWTQLLEPASSERR